jgi:hypothetical protein
MLSVTGQGTESRWPSWLVVFDSGGKATCVWRSAAVSGKVCKMWQDQRLDGLVPATADGVADSVADAVAASEAAHGGTAQNDAK